MATQYDPIAKDESLNTTEVTPRNIADVLAEELSGIASALTPAQLNSLADVTISSPSDGQTLKYDAATQKWVNANDAGGHTIENPSGTDMTQRGNLQFTGDGVSVTDDAVDGKTIVDISPDAEDIPYGNTSSGLSATDVQGAIDAVEGQIANSSDAYSASKAYAIGDYCIYNDTLYRCITACSAASWAVNSGCFLSDTVVGSLQSKNQKSITLPWITYDNSKTATYTIPLPSFYSYCIVRVMLSHTQDFYGVYEEHYIRHIGNYLSDVTVARIEHSTQYNNFTYNVASTYGNNPTLSITTGSALGHCLSVDFDYM